MQEQMDIRNLSDLFCRGVEEIHAAESMIAGVLPRLAATAHAGELAKTLHAQMTDNKRQLERLESLMALLGLKGGTADCPPVAGMLAEAELCGAIEDPATRDAALLATLQTTANYLVARYDILLAWARLLGMKDAADLLAASREVELAVASSLGLVAGGRPGRKADDSIGARLTALFDRKR